jgi:hypothetical protein
VTNVSLERGVAIAGTLALLLFVFELVRRKHLSERYAILWLLAAVTLFVLAAWKGLLTSLSHDVGIDYPPSALFAVAIGLIVILLMYFSLVVSRLSDQNKILAQRIALLQRRVERVEEPHGQDDADRELFRSRSGEGALVAENGTPATTEPARHSALATEELSSSR